MGRDAGLIGMCSNLALFALKLFAGLAAGSVAIIADAVNNIADAGASLITIISFRLAGKPADPEHPYGHARIEYIAGLILSFIITVIGVELLGASVEKLFAQERAQYSALSLLILAISAAVKLLQGFMYSKVGSLTSSATLTAAAADSRNDVLATGTVLIGAAISMTGRLSLDSWLGAAVAIFIICSGVKLIIEASSPLLGDAPDADTVKLIRAHILSTDGVLNMHDLMVHNYGPGRCFASAHVEMAAERNILECHDIIDNIELDLLHEHNIHMVIHLDPVVTGDERTNSLRLSTAECVDSVLPGATIHDFRAVYGATHTNLIFDVCAPIDTRLTDAELCHRITGEVRARIGEHFNTVITVDRSYVSTVNEDLEK